LPAYVRRNGTVLRNRSVQGIIGALEPAAAAQGFELVDVELTGLGKAAVVRVFIDKPGGLVVDELASANTWIAAVIDGLDPVKGSYTLEVSSPGIDRPLRTAAHFVRFAGETVVVATEPLEGRSKWTGVLKGCVDDKVIIEVDGHEVGLDLLSIKKAHVKGVIDFNRKDR
jgi:ribosome maturation factor RimP